MRSRLICGLWMVAISAQILAVAPIPLTAILVTIIPVLILRLIMGPPSMLVPLGMCKEQAGMAAMANISRFPMIMAMLRLTAI